MKDLEQKGYSRRVPEEKKTEGIPAWYLPHHPVSHPKKLEKTRSVFDCTTKHDGSNLNDKLMQEPDITNSLIGVLSRFREESTALTADIESMFYQVHVRPEDSDYLRYLRWPDGDLEKEPEEYQMCVHLFGGVSSPSCASFALQKAAEDNKSNFSEEAVKNMKHNQLHNFFDASAREYGAVSYLRLVDCNGRIHCSFVLGKSRLTPMTKITIPRLEIAAAATATKVSSMIQRGLDLPIDEDIYWTDSTRALGYITNEDRRFKTFVANKISVIHENSHPNQWHYVNTKLNPTDDASRGLSAEELVNNERWLKGPDFLWSSEDNWPRQSDVTIAVKENDLEVKEEIKAPLLLCYKQQNKPNRQE